VRPASTSRASSPESLGARRALALGGAWLLLGGLACGGGDDAAAQPTTFGGTAVDSQTGTDEGSDTSAGDDSASGETDAPPPPDCAPGEDVCGTLCTDLDTDPANCGQCGVSCVIPQAAAACEQGECALASCDVGFSDCDGDIATGCEVAVECRDGESCETTCGSQGIYDCSDVCSGGGDPACLPPVETCNVADDNCDGACDEGSLPGCRVGVHRSYSATQGHFYTTDLGEAQGGDLNLESENYFYLYGPGVEGLMPLFRCIKGNGKRWLSSSIDCEGTGAPELTVGFISPDERCGATPLYRLLNAGPDAHFYTTSAGERDNAINNLGYQDQGIAGYIWSGP